MPEKILLLILFVLLRTLSFSQPADSVYNKYLDFNLARFQGEDEKTRELGEALIPDAGKLPEKARINFYFAIGKMYEDNDEPKKAMPYYEKVTVAAPDYYVAHRALGYIYLDQSKAIRQQLDAYKKDDTTRQNLTRGYDEAVKKTLMQLEKAQACDPSDETLAIIKSLYGDINDVAGLRSLDKRLKALSKNCLDILSDQ